MTSPLKPIYLLADSQLLFWKKDGSLFINSLKTALAKDNPKAAYIGASNGDLPVFYYMFVDAMMDAGIVDCRMISSAYSEEDAQFVEQADLILLSGGDVAAGWKIFSETGLNDTLIRRYAEGALLVGVSAGAVQLGTHGWIDKNALHRELFKTLSLVPFLIDVHGEREGWQQLRSTIELLDSGVKGIGIPSGGGIIYHPDHTVEPVRFQAVEYLMTDDKKLTDSILLPA